MTATASVKHVGVGNVGATAQSGSVCCCNRARGALRDDSGWHEMGGRGKTRGQCRRFPYSCFCFFVVLVRRKGMGEIGSQRN